MKCCACNKELDRRTVLDKNGIAKWYGKYEGWLCTKAICNTCIKDPKKKEEYVKKK